jgi:hypothetical protein
MKGAAMEDRYNGYIKTKLCPFLENDCRQNDCAWWENKVNSCAVWAVGRYLSELSWKAAQAEQSPPRP